MSPNGMYYFRFNFNGDRRVVGIDDQLPVSKTERMLHIIDRNNPCLLWPALIEKAYLKVRGGYDFPGSNSNTDLWIMTGWIPEIVFLQKYVWYPSMTMFFTNEFVEPTPTGSGIAFMTPSIMAMFSSQWAQEKSP